MGDSFKVFFINLQNMETFRFIGNLASILWSALNNKDYLRELLSGIGDDCVHEFVVQPSGPKGEIIIDSFAGNSSNGTSFGRNGRQIGLHNLEYSPLLLFHVAVNASDTISMSNDLSLFVEEVASFFSRPGVDGIVL